MDYDGPRYGVLSDDGTTVQLMVGDPFGEVELSDDFTTLTQSPGLVPVTPTKVMAIGRNYAQHAEEVGLTIGSAPSAFIKPPQALISHGGTVVLPPRELSARVEHEAELAIVIGRTARNVSAHEAFDYVLGITCANDVTARDLQRRDPQLTRGKGFDTFCPLGLAVETGVRADVDYEVSCRVNGEERQRGNTKDLIYPLPYLIAWLSAWTTLIPGDVILTGSPAGSAELHPGDQVEISVDGVATLSHVVAASDCR